MHWFGFYGFVVSTNLASYVVFLRRVGVKRVRDPSVDREVLRLLRVRIYQRLICVKRLSSRDQRHMLIQNGSILDSSNGDGRSNYNGRIERNGQVGRSNWLSGYYAIYLLKIRDEALDRGV